MGRGCGLWMMVVVEMDGLRVGGIWVSVLGGGYGKVYVGIRGWVEVVGGDMGGFW